MGISLCIPLSACGQDCRKDKQDSEKGGKKRAGYGSGMSPWKKQYLWSEGFIGVYSPIHRIGKTRFALQLGQK